MSQIVLRPSDSWRSFHDELVAENRAATMMPGAARAHEHVASAAYDGGGEPAFWVAAEREHIVRAAYSDVSIAPALPPLPFEVEAVDGDAARVMIVRAALEASGPRTALQLSEALALPEAAGGRCAAPTRGGGCDPPGPLHQGRRRRRVV